MFTAKSEPTNSRGKDNFIHTYRVFALLESPHIARYQIRLEWYLNGERLIVSRSSMPDASSWGSRKGQRAAENEQLALWDLTELSSSGRLRSGWLYCVAINIVGRAISPPVWVRFARKTKRCQTYGDTNDS